MGRISEEFLADWFTLTFTSDEPPAFVLFQARALKDWTAGW